MRTSYAVLIVLLSLPAAFSMSVRCVYGQTSKYFEIDLPEERWPSAASTALVSSPEEATQREQYLDDPLHEADVVIIAFPYTNDTNNITPDEWARTQLQRALDEFSSEENVLADVTVQDPIQAASGELFSIWKVQFVARGLSHTAHFGFYVTETMRYFLFVVDAGLALETDAQGHAMKLIMGSLTLNTLE